MTKALAGLAELVLKGGVPKTKAQEVLEIHAKKSIDEATEAADRAAKIIQRRKEANIDRFGYDPNEVSETTSYRMMHKAPSIDEGFARLDDLTGKGTVFPSDIYSSKGLSLYGNPKYKADQESFNIIQRVHNKADAEVTIYRAIPKEIPDKINPGDWVTLSKQYAKDHAASGYGFSGTSSGKVISKKVKVKELFSGGNDLNEFGYTPIKKNKTKEELQNISDEDLSLEDIKKKYKVNQKQKRIPEVQTAAQKLYEGKIDKEFYDRVVKAYQPINLITEMPEVPSLKRIQGTLKSNQLEEGVVGINKKGTDLDGKRVASRLDIPAYENYDTWIVSLHDGTKTGGKAIGYGQSAVLKNVEFKSSEKGGLNIARGKTPKATIGRIHGDYLDTPTKKVFNKIQLELNDPNSEYIQVGMNPFRHSYFYDKKTGEPILAAEEVLQLGPLVLGKGIVKGKPTDFKFKTGGIVMRNDNYNTQRVI